MQELWVKIIYFFLDIHLYNFDSSNETVIFSCQINFKENLDNKEPENPVVYLSNLVKKLDVKNRNGLVALAIVNLLVILLFKFYLKGSGLLS